MGSRLVTHSHDSTCFSLRWHCYPRAKPRAQLRRRRRRRLRRQRRRRRPRGADDVLTSGGAAMINHYYLLVVASRPRQTLRKRTITSIKFRMLEIPSLRTRYAPTTPFYIVFITILAIKRFWSLRLLRIASRDIRNLEIFGWDNISFGSENDRSGNGVVIWNSFDAHFKRDLPHSTMCCFTLTEGLNDSDCLCASNCAK